MTGEAVTQAGGKNDENVSVIGREQCGYSRNASKFTGEDYPLCLRLNGRRERSGPPAMRMGFTEGTTNQPDLASSGASDGPARTEK